MKYPSLITIHSFTSFNDFSCSKNNSDQELKGYYLNRLGYRYENYKEYYHIINQSNNMTKKEICAGLTEMKLAPLLSLEISCSEAFSQCTNKWDKVTGWLLIVQLLQGHLSLSIMIKHNQVYCQYSFCQKLEESRQTSTTRWNIICRIKESIFAGCE